MKYIHFQIYLFFRTKTAKAAKQLNTIRRWAVTGTPIQNNLLELWSLVHWLEFDLYSESMIDFKIEIERPCKVSISNMDVLNAGGRRYIKL